MFLPKRLPLSIRVKIMCPHDTMFFHPTHKKASLFMFLQIADVKRHLLYAGDVTIFVIFVMVYFWLFTHKCG